METIRVVLAEDNPIIRAFLRSMLEKAPEIEIVGEVQDGLGAVRMVEFTRPDILILDIEMPVLDGLAVIRQLHALEIPVHILVVSVHDESHYIQCVIANGASGYLVKDEAPEMLVEAVRGIKRGEQGWLSKRAVDRLFRQRESARLTV